MVRKSVAFVLTVFCLGILISGCAFGTRRPVLKYELGTTTRPSKNINVYVAPFNDERTEKDVIGHVRNAYGMKTAKIITVTNISSWITNALKAELENVGYTVVEDQNNDIAISGEVIKVYVTSMMMYEGEVSAEITVVIDGKEVFTNKYSGSDESINIAVTAKSYGITLERSLQEALVEAVFDIDREILKRKER